MDRLDGARTSAPEGVAQPRCVTCQRFARLLPGETRCARCSGVLALEFGEITASADAVVRGWLVMDPHTLLTVIVVGSAVFGVVWVLHKIAKALTVTCPAFSGQHSCG
jgi:hypothetical protein